MEAYQTSSPHASGNNLNTADASLDALTSYYTIKQKENENIRQFKDSLLAAVERIESVDPTKAPPEDEQARKFTMSLDPRTQVI